MEHSGIPFHEQLQAQMTDSHLQIIADTAPVAIVYIDAEERYVFGNRHYEQRFGRALQDIIGKTVLEAVGEVQYRRVRPMLREALSGKTVEFRTQIPRAGQSSLDVHAVYAPHLGADGQVLGLVAISQDITQIEQSKAELERAQESVRFAEAKYQSLIDALPHIVWITEPNGHASFYNQAWYDYSGIPAGNTRYELVQQTIHPADLLQVSAAWEAARKNQQAFEHEMRIMRHDGVYRWFLVKTVPLLDSFGKVLKWFGTSTDIHATKTAAQQATFLQKLSAALLKVQTPDAVLATVIGVGGESIDAGGALLVWKNDMDGSLEVLGGVGYPEGFLDHLLKCGLTHDSPLVECIQTQKPVFVPNYDCLKKSYPLLKDTRRYSGWAAIPIFEDGVAKGALGLSFEKPQEFDHDQRGLIQIVVDECAQALTKVVLLNELRLYAKKTAELREISSALSRAVTETMVLEVIRERVFHSFLAVAGALVQLESDGQSLRCLAAAGSISDQIVECHKIPHDGSWPISRALTESRAYFFGSNEDLVARFPAVFSSCERTETRALAVIPMISHDQCFGAILFAYNKPRKFTENTQKLMQALASYCAEALERSRLYDISQKAVQARDSLISISSHELLTPVTSMKLQLELLERSFRREEKVPDEAVLKVIEQNSRQLLRLESLVKDMLDLSRINSGKLTIKRTKTDLSVLAKETVEQMSGQIKNAGCQVSVSLEPELVGYWDSYRIEQVIANLINNACRYAAQKPMTISTFRQGSNAVLVVEDQGKGIAKSDQTRIFQRFEKAENTNNGQGLGLGLFIIHQIVEAHGGSIQVESDLGQGARFRVELPLALPEKS